MTKTSRCIVSGLLVLAAICIFWYMTNKGANSDTEIEYVAEIPEVVVEPITTKVIGSSVEGRDIQVHTFGNGEKKLLFVGGIHGGYEWNSVYLAYEMIDYLTANIEKVPDDVSVAIIPSLNPDGVFTVLGKEGRFALTDTRSEDTSAGKGRFNAHDIDLNRNFDCKWEPESMWRGNVVSAGEEAFSEPEAAALRAYVNTEEPEAVVFWHSQSNAVYASECEEGVLPETLTLMNTYADAAGYPKVETFDAYEITGDAEGWLASIGIPAVTVELSTHDTIEWDKNLSGVQALMSHYSQIP